MERIKEKFWGPVLWRVFAGAVALGILATQVMLLRSFHSLRSEISRQQQGIERILVSLPACREAYKPDRTAQLSVAGHVSGSFPAGRALALTPDHEMPDAFREFFASERAFQAMFQRMADEFDRLESVVDLDRAWTTLRATPAMDIRDDGWNYVVLFDMPGASSSDVHVGLDGRLLQVRYAPVGTDTRGQGRARLDRRIWLPGPVCGAEKLNTVLSNGMLKIVVPKQSPAQETPHVD
jgi:HSP20 family molecular chaperone IbpA